MANRIDRIGEEKTNTFGSLMRIINYRNNKDIDVFFPEHGWTKEHTEYRCFIKGEIKSPYECRTFGKGYLGEGRHNALINGKRTKCYDVWRQMIERCYSTKYHDRQPTYIDCEVQDSWLNFQIFSDGFKLIIMKLKMNKSV